MISWIQNALEKKGRVIFIILLAVVIVSFVFVIGETPGCVGKEPGAQVQKFYGYTLSAESDPRSREMLQEVVISSIVNRGQQPQSEQALTQEFLSRIALLHLADISKIPEPTQDAFVQYLASIPFFQDQNGNFDPNRVTNFLDMTQLSRQFDEATINQALSNDYRIAQLMSAVAEPGFTLPFEIEEQARRIRASYDLSIAQLDADKVDLSINASPEDLETFFTQQVEAYRTPEKRILTAAMFSPEKFGAEIADPTDTEIEAFFADNRTNYLNPDAEDPTKALPSLEDVRDQVISDWKAEQSTVLTLQKSEEFVYALFDQNVEANSPVFSEVAEHFGAELVSLPEMVGNTPPADTDLPTAAFREAARLDQIRYYSDPVQTENGVVVMVLTQSIPSEIPDYESVKDAVVADYTSQKEQELLVTRGSEIRAQLTEKLNSGESFADAADDLGLSLQDFDGASWENIPAGLNGSFLQKAETLPNGEVSEMVVNDQGGQFLFVNSRGAPEFSNDSDEYQQAKSMLAANTSRLFISSFVGDLIQSGSSPAENR